MSAVPPIVAVKPTPLTWVLLLVSPVPILLGVALLSTRHFGWGALFVAAGILNFGRCARILWRWRRSRPASGLASQTTNASFIGNEVSWVPARLHQGLSFQPGWAVVRPDWAAFLPSAAAAHLVGEMAWAVSGFARGQLGTVTYDFAASWRRGPQDFDQTVLHLSQQGGYVLRATEGDLVKLAKGTMLRADEKNFILCDARLPDALVATWRAGAVKFNAGETAKLFAIITAVPAVLGAVGGTVAYFKGESPTMICVGVGFWWSLVLFGWVGYFVAYRRSKRAR